jgi:NDP-sugar pyrophosphorylase family protein
MNKPTLIILAGGKGTRLGNLTKEIPKPMVDVCGKPFLFWLIDYYYKQGFRNIIISTGYKANVIEEYSWPWDLKFRRDDDVFGMEWTYKTKCAWVVNGDTWIDNPLPEVSCNPIILSYNNVDAGAQYTGLEFGYKMKISPSSVFYDIGTLGGLESFRGYCRTQLITKGGY